MAKRDLTSLIGTDLRDWPLPLAEAVSEALRPQYVARCEALRAVVGGSSYRAAGNAYDVDPRTVAKDAERAPLRHDDGHLVGFRACLPFRHRLPKEQMPDDAPSPPTRGCAYAFTRLVASSPAIDDLVHNYKGNLPGGTTKCRAFDRHFKEFKAKVRATHGEACYPLKEPDEGRRALLNYHKRLRKLRRDAGAAELAATELSITRFGQLFTLAPLDRLEFDAHKEDVDWVLDIPEPNGQVVQRRITKVTLLALVCAVSRYLVAYLLVLGEYNHVHVLQLIHRALATWRARELIVPGMEYPPGAVLGLPSDTDGCCARGMAVAGDNAKAHHAHLNVGNHLDHYRGVLNLGKAHVPEGRPIIEAFFRRLAEGALRHIAGGFHPQTRANDRKVPTSYLRAVEHPLHWEGMLDLMDVICAGYNVTPHNSLRVKSPSSVLTTHLASGWCWQATEAARDAQRLTTVRFTARIRGDKSAGRHPFVQFYDALYRSQRLMGQWDWVGKQFAAEANIEDLRHVVLLDPDDKTPWSRLTALPPWNQSKHDLHLRQQIIRTRNRGMLDIVGAQDAIAAYHEFARAQALSGRTSADQFARLDAQRGPGPTTQTVTAVPVAVQPRSGRTSFAQRKD